MYIKDSLDRIKKRLGGDRYQELMGIFKQACQEQLLRNSFSKHRDWIEILLKDYYDPMYQYQIDNNTKKIIFKGNQKEVLEYMKSHVLE
jgi:tRNA 2-selenouridine synthase